MVREEVRYWEPQIELMAKERFQRLQLERLRHMLKYVYERIPFYHRKFDEANVKPDDLRTLDDLQKFPFTVKDELREHGPPHGLLAVPRERLVNFQMSSGTTGVATIYPYTRSDIELWTNLIARQMTCAGVRPGDLILNAYGYHLFTGGLGTHYGAHRMGASVIPWGAGRTDALIDALRDRGATVLAGTPSYMYHISERIQERGIDPVEELNLRIALPGAEIWSPGMRERINEGLGLRAHGGGARDYYGSSDQIGPGGGGECVFERGIHFWTDHFYLEIIDPDTGETLGPGEEGEMVFTHLTREAQPLIRFRQGDITVVDKESCECGRVFPLLSRITGRADDMVIYKGSKFWPRQVEAVLMRFPEVTGEYQIVWNKTAIPPEVYVKVESKTPTVELENRLRQAFLDELLVRPKVEFVEPGTLPRSMGKAKRLIVK
ncbi:MAG: phenylacetate--CoA ligase family protein [Candidatus Bathyarchaeia archaeon]